MRRAASLSNLAGRAQFLSTDSLSGLRIGILFETHNLTARGGPMLPYDGARDAEACRPSSIPIRDPESCSCHRPMY